MLHINSIYIAAQRANSNQNSWDRRREEFGRKTGSREFRTQFKKIEENIGENLLGNAIIANNLKKDGDLIKIFGMINV